VVAGLEGGVAGAVVGGRIAGVSQANFIFVSQNPVFHSVLEANVQRFTRLQSIMNLQIFNIVSGLL